MAGYTIVITPDDPKSTSITMRVQTGDATAVLRELTLHAGDETGLAAGDLPVLDLNALVRAATAAITPPTSGTVSAPDTTGRARGQADRTAAAPDTKVRSRRRTEAAADASGTAIDRDSEHEAKPPRGTAAGTAAAPAKRPGRRATKATAPADAATGGDRVYRRLPDDFAAVMRQSGDNATAIADHYNVPTHTAYGWIRTARRRQAQTPA